jgi:hypothetical protein
MFIETKDAVARRLMDPFKEKLAKKYVNLLGFWA